MTTDEARHEAVRLLMEKADEAIRAAREVKETSPSAAINRAYYECFYAASAVLIAEGRKFVKHAGVQVALHKHLVHPGRLPKELGRAYDELTVSRHQADYEPVMAWTPENAKTAIEKAEKIVTELRTLLPPRC